jgi:hypothetical protein
MYDPDDPELQTMAGRIINAIKDISYLMSACQGRRSGRSYRGRATCSR